MNIMLLHCDLNTEFVLMFNYLFVINIANACVCIIILKDLQKLTQNKMLLTHPNVDGQVACNEYTNLQISVQCTCY